MTKQLPVTYLRYSILIFAAALFICPVVSAQPREITLSGFNADVVADSGLNQTDPTLITSLPLGAFPGDVFYAQGYSNNATPYANGLPGNRQLVTASALPFQLAAYNTSNDLRLGQFDFGTLVFSNADRISYDSLVVLATGAGGSAAVNYLILFTDLSSASGSMAVSDWSCMGCTNYAINNLSAIDRTSGAVSGTNQYAMFQYTIHLAGDNRKVYGILFSVDVVETSVAHIFSITGFPSSPLPVSLVYYNATVHNGSALLQWKTAQELNDKAYIIERAGSAAPDIFVQVGTIAAATSATNGSTYSFYNTPGTPGTYFYKLTQVDIDGKKKVMGIRSITINGPATWVVQDIGNQWRLTSAEAFTYRLIDMNGSVIKTGVGSSGGTTISKPSAKGIYIIQVLMHGESLTQRVIN